MLPRSGALCVVGIRCAEFHTSTIRAGPRLPPRLAAASAWAGCGDAAQQGLVLCSSGACCGLGPGVLSASVPFMRLSEQFPQVRGWPGAQRQAMWHRTQEASATVPSRVDAAASVPGCGPVSGWQGLGWSVPLLSWSGGQVLFPFGDEAREAAITLVPVSSLLRALLAAAGSSPQGGLGAWEPPTHQPARLVEPGRQPALPAPGIHR